MLKMPLKGFQMVVCYLLFPTETLYGLGADATNPDGLARLYQIKGQPIRHPVIPRCRDRLGFAIFNPCPLGSCSNECTIGTGAGKHY